MNRFGLGSACSLGLFLLLSCSSGNPDSEAMKSAQRVIRFVETGDTTLLRGVFTDSLLQLMSIEGMLATRDDFKNQFGPLEHIDGPEFPTDTTANVVLHYEQTSLLAELEFTNTGKIRYVSIQPAPVADTGERSDDSHVLADLAGVEPLRSDFNADSDHVRLVVILSPT
jgi:hypothetical protein